MLKPNLMLLALLVFSAACAVEGRHVVRGDKGAVPDSLATPVVEIDQLMARVSVSDSLPVTDKKLLDSLRHAIDYPRLAHFANVAGRVLVNFTVDSVGQAREVKVQQGIGAGCDEAVVVGVKSINYPPPRPPSTSYTMTLSVRFVLQEPWRSFEEYRRAI